MVVFNNRIFLARQPSHAVDVSDIHITEFFASTRTGQTGIASMGPDTPASANTNDIKIKILRETEVDSDIQIGHSVSFFQRK